MCSDNRILHKMKIKAKERKKYESMKNIAKLE